MGHSWWFGDQVLSSRCSGTFPTCRGNEHPDKCSKGAESSQFKHVGAWKRCRNDVRIDCSRPFLHQGILIDLVVV